VDQLRELLDRLPSPILHVILSGVGEPLLNPHFFEMVDHLMTRGITCHFFTNGTLLSPEKSDAILKRDNIVSLTISCDSADEATFEILRLGANFERWKRSVRNFTERAGHERPALRIGMNTVVSTENIHELRDIVRLAADLGMRSINFLDPIPVDEISAASVPTDDEFNAINFNDLSKFGKSLGLRTSWSLRQGKEPSAAVSRCLRPWDMVFIRVNGNVQPCMALFGTDKAAVMGNIFQEDFAGIWNGDLYREYRRTHNQGTNPLCQVCPYS
jgi:radical SAM protein with 4Fe4S-binding SPASM domain